MRPTKFIFITLIILFLPLLGLAWKGVSVAQAETLPMPSLAEFAESLPASDGVAGVYADGVFAFPVVRQPRGNAGFVSSQPAVVTLFSMASQYNTIGLLAHNNLAGAEFDRLLVGQTITLVYASGEVKTYEVAAVERYQALSPASPYSDFINLDTHQRQSASELFTHVYAPGQRLVLQTCIAAKGMLSWGRLFIIALPKPRPALPLSLYEPMPSVYLGFGLSAK